jgi:hypothetical protein
LPLPFVGKYLSQHVATSTASKVTLKGLQPINLVVTGLVVVLGAVALYSGLRRHYPRYASFLGHTRFSNYFMITIYPIQAQHTRWSGPGDGWLPSPFLRCRCGWFYTLD